MALPHVEAVYEFVTGNFTVEEALGRATLAFLGHPFDYVKILVQLGYEPMPAYPSKTMWGRPTMALPNLFKYLQYIKRTDGYTGLYRGVRFKIAYALVHGFVYVNATEMVKAIHNSNQQIEKKKTEDGEDESTTGAKREVTGIFTLKQIRELLEKLMTETICKFLALGVSYPFQVMVIRCCSQFVGRETTYDTFTGAVCDIYNNSGLRGFYVGFVPRFLGECLILWTTHGLIFVVKGLLFSETESTNMIQGYVSVSINFLVTSLMYPFQLVSTVMVCNGTDAASLESSALSGRDPYVDWIDCWQHLSRIGCLKRGASLFFRNQPDITKSYIHKLS